MERVTTNGDRNQELRSRLEVIPPTEPAAEQSHIDTVVEMSRREKSKCSKPKRKLQTEPLAETPEEFSDTIVSSHDTAVQPGGRKPLPLAAIPCREVSIEELLTLEPEVFEPMDLLEPVDCLQTPSPQRPAVPPTNSREQLQAISHWHKAVESEPVSRLDRVAKFMSGWASSFVIHTLLIIIFALLTFAIPDDSKVMLSLDNVDVERMDTETFEVSVDFDPIQESSVSDMDDTTTEELSDELTNEMLDADEIITEMEDFGIETLSGEGVGSKLGGGGAMMAGADGQKGVAGESVDFFGSYAKGNRFVFVIDCSGSMMGERWRRAKYELERSINGLGEDQKFCVVLYNSGTQVMMGGKKIEMLAATGENREKMSKWLNRQYPNGGTYPRNAVTRSLEANPDAIFLLSDGEIQDNTQDFLLAKNRNRDSGQGDYAKIPVHTIALLSTFGQQMLKAIADDNEGTFTRVGRR